MTNLQQQVQQLMDARVEAGTEDGMQVAVYRHGELLVDAVTGVADPATGRPVRPDTLFYAASMGKAVAATVAHVLVERGVLDYDRPFVDLWPEFGAHGKGTATLRHVLTHSVGLPAVPPDTTPERLCDWDAMCGTLAEAEPWWQPGERVGYQAQTYGFLVGEIVRRATGKRISQVLAEEVAGPLGAGDELYFGVPASELPRVARLRDDPDGMAAFAQFAPQLPLFTANPAAVTPNAAFANRGDVLSADIPSGATLTARALARMYAALLDEVDGVRLVSPERLREITALATAGLQDEMTGGPATYALGYTVGRPGTFAPEEQPDLFGMVGIGVGAAFADRRTGVSVAVTRNRFNPVEMQAVEQVGELVATALDNGGSPR
ncbi:MAG TPA: serine hydrolase domain-containing protein [Candidatus Binatia bacterium]|jgi:CubicO group peptidase (beta-lactamase class C family)|nr:serine hydrolase domain-containing protein [Candidatus Binatia bacterium]